MTDKEGNSPLHLAAREGHADVTRLLVLTGANVAAVNKRGDTPLQLAVLFEHDDVITELTSDSNPQPVALP